MSAMPVDLENFIIVESAVAWADLIVQDRERGSSGRLRDAVITLTQGRTIIAVHLHNDDRMLTSWFRVPEPLPASMHELLCEFLMDLGEWLEGRQAAPKLPVPEPRVTLH
jgi:hypothetical protein